MIHQISSQLNYLTPQTTPSKAKDLAIEDKGFVGQLEVNEGPSFFDRIMTDVVLKSPHLYLEPLAHLAPRFFKDLFIKLSDYKLSEKEKEKITSINTLIDEVKPHLGLQDIEHSLYVDTDYMFYGKDTHNFAVMGNSSSYCGPVMLITKSYFDAYCADHSLSPSLQEALHLLKSLPNDPIEMGLYLDQLSESDRKHLLQTIDSHKTSLTTEEFKAVIAHELGHAKQHHKLRKTGVNFIFNTTIATILATLAYLRKGDLFLRVAAVFIASSYLYEKQISRLHEYEADKESSNKTEYLLGMQSFLKRALLEEITRNSSNGSEETNLSSSEIIRLLMNSSEDENTHPHTAKRLQKINEIIKTGTRAPSEMGRTAQLSASIGYACIYGEIAFTYACKSISKQIKSVSELFSYGNSQETDIPNSLQV